MCSAGTRYGRRVPQRGPDDGSDGVPATEEPAADRLVPVARHGRQPLALEGRIHTGPHRIHQRLFFYLFLTILIFRN